MDELSPGKAGEFDRMNRTNRIGAVE